MSVLTYESQLNVLILRGVLDRETLLPIWKNRAALLVDKTEINVKQLKRVDSAGLALLAHLRAYQHRRSVKLIISGATDRLRALVALYNLQAVIPVQW